jgi:hypothetical protein
MAYKDKQLLTDAYGKPIPQYWDEDSNSYKPLQDPNSAKAKEPFSGTSNFTKTFSKPMNGIVISNDGASDLTITIGTDIFTVKAGEVFSEMFEPFTQVIVTTTVPYRAYGLGD